MRSGGSSCCGCAAQIRESGRWRIGSTKSGCNIDQRFQHEGVVQLRTRQLEVARAIQHQGAEIDDIHVQRPIDIAGITAVTTLGDLLRMQPMVECEGMDAAMKVGNGVEEVGAIEAHRLAAIHG